MNGRSLFLSLVVFFSVLMNPLHASFSQRKSGVSVRVRDLSTQQDRKLIGSDIGAREMRELNMQGIFPILIELKNRSDESFVFAPGSVSVPTYSPLQMEFKVPTICGKSFLSILGGFFSMYAGVRVGAFTFAHAYEKPSSDEADSSDKDGSLMDELKTCKRCKLGLVSTLGLIYLGFKGMQYGFHKHSSRKKNQQAWLNKWMLQPQGVVLKPNTRVEKFIFLDKKTYQQGGFTLRLDALLGSNLCFEISILP